MPLLSEDEQPGRIWATVCHLSALAGFLIPLGNIIGPLIVWLLLRHDYSFVEEQGKEALNFQLSITIYFILGLFTLLLLIGFIVLPLISLFALISIIIASIETAQGKHFRYPLSIRFFN